MPIYMQVEGVEGDVTVESHKGWISLHSASWGTSRAITTHGYNDSRNAATVTVREVVVTQDRDSSTGAIWKSHINNEPKGVQIDWVATASGGDNVFMSIKLKEALVSSFSMHGHANDQPIVELSFNFVTIDGTFYGMVEKGVKSNKAYMVQYQLYSGMSA